MGNRKSKKTMRKKIKIAFKKSLQSYKESLPILVATLLLLNLVEVFWSGKYEQLFTGNYFKDTIIGALFGSFSFGIPLTSYIIGGELQKEGISLLAITAFIMTWSTVGIVMLPWEIVNLGKRFAIVRNIINFILAIIISIVTVYLVNFLK